MRERMVSANSSSRNWWSVPATSLRKIFTSTTWKSNVPYARARTMPKSASRIMTGIGRAPLVAGEEAGVDVVNVRLERRFKAVLPALERGEDGDVVGDQRVFARPEGVAELAQVDELRRPAISRTMSCAPRLISLSSSGKRHESVSRESSCHWMISSSCVFR